MAIAPFELTIAADARDRWTLVFEETLRDLPGSRRSGRARTRGRHVFVKLLLDPARAEAQVRREVAGHEALARHGLPTPELLFAGVAAEAPPALAGARALVYEWLPGAVTAAAALTESELSDRERRRRWEEMARLVAAHHRAGLVHGDLHLDNLAWSGGALHTLDAGAVEAGRAPVERTRARANLAVLLAQLDPHRDAWLPDLLRAYREAGGSGHLWPSLWEAVCRQRRRRLRRFGRKVMRTCRLCREVEMGGGPGLVRRDEGAEDLVAALGPWLLSPEGTALPDGLRADFHDGLMGFRRAAAAWRNAHVLALLDVPGPVPVALVRARPRPGGWFLSESPGPSAAPGVEHASPLARLLARLDVLGLDLRRPGAGTFEVVGGGVRLRESGEIRLLPDRPFGAPRSRTGAMADVLAALSGHPELARGLDAELGRLGYP